MDGTVLTNRLGERKEWALVKKAKERIHQRMANSGVRAKIKESEVELAKTARATMAKATSG